MFPRGPLTLLCTCARGTERAVKFELKNQGLDRSQILRGAVQLEATLEDIPRINVHSRIASKVLWRLHAFTAKTEEELIEELSTLPFESLVAPHTTIAVESHLFSTPWNNDLYASQRVKDVIVDRIREKRGDRPDVDPKTPAMRFVLYWNGADANLSLDTTGMPLGRRGYRIDGGPAPIRETLAAAILAIAHADVERPFLDPCCGSGTIAIEQAMRSMNMAPNGQRRFAFQRWKSAPKSLRNALRETREAAKAAEVDARAAIRMSDIDAKQIERARVCMRAAGVGSTIKSAARAAADITISDGEVVVANVPFGERMSHDAKDELKALYRALGDRARSKKHVRLVLFSTHLKTESFVGLGSAKKWPLYSGPLRGTLYRWDL